MQQDEADINYAGFWIRLLATVIDVIILQMITLPILFSVYGKAYFESKDLIKGPVDFLVSFILPAIAVIVLWRYKSATPGKMIISAQIVDSKTLGKPSNSQLIIRYLAYLISTIPFCIGFIWIAFDKRKQSWHDKLAKTIVIRAKKNN